MNGIICINKPVTFTSFDVIAKVRGITKVKKIGHSGTLDPLASGVLPLFFGNATKAISYIPDGDKIYRAKFLLGKTTDTQDITGKILSESFRLITKSELLNVINKYIGEISQIPPMYSALKVNGQKLYDLARKGMEIERQPRKISIYDISLLQYDEKSISGEIEIKCSSGTYIRTLIHDIGSSLGAGGIMTDLIRVKSNGFLLENCYTIEQIQKLSDENKLNSIMTKIDELFNDLPHIKLDEKQTALFCNGVKLDFNRLNHENESGIHSVYSNSDVFLGLAHPDNDMTLIIDKIFNNMM